MRNIYLIINVLAALSVTAQSSKFSINPSPNMISFPLDGTDHTAHGKMINTTRGTLELSWVLEPLQVPQGWTLFVCDAVTCYGPGVYACPEDRANVLGPYEEGSLDVHAVDSGEIAEAHVVMTLYEKEDTNSFVKADYLFNKVVSNKKVYNITTKVYPNPAYNSFSVDFNAGLTRIDLFNLLGGKVVSFPAVQNKSYDISLLPAGLYFIKLYGPNNQLLRTIRLQKRTLKA